MPETLCDYLSRLSNKNNLILICDKDKTIHYYNWLKDISFTDIPDYCLEQDIIEEQKYFDRKGNNYIIFLVVDIYPGTRHYRRSRKTRSKRN